MLVRIENKAVFSLFSGGSLNSYISYFEPVYFDSTTVRSQLESRRVRRSVGDTQTINIDFRAQNRSDQELSPDKLGQCNLFIFIPDCSAFVYLKIARIFLLRTSLLRLQTER